MAPHLQPGILALGARSHHYLEFDLLDGANPQEVLDIAGDGLGESRVTTAGVNVVVGFSKRVWDQLGDSPADLVDFETITGPDGFTMPADQHDVWVWVSGATIDGVFDTARAVAAAFAPVATLAEQHSAFAYHDSRDLSGFVDGTENPALSAAADVITIPDGESGAGGTIVFVQRWIHDLAAFHSLDLETQEANIGRTKDTDEEFEPDVMPPSAHVARVAIKEDGKSLEMFRRSTPYGDVDECGLMFVGFTPDTRRIDLMLRHMVGFDGPRDAITNWSTPVNGGYYYVPSTSELG